MQFNCEVSSNVKQHTDYAYFVVFGFDKEATSRRFSYLWQPIYYANLLRSTFAASTMLVNAGITSAH